jgi:hypothetical protein
VQQIEKGSKMNQCNKLFLLPKFNEKCVIQLQRDTIILKSKSKERYGINLYDIENSIAALPCTYEV